MFVEPSLHLTQSPAADRAASAADINLSLNSYRIRLQSAAQDVLALADDVIKYADLGIDEDWKD